MASLSRDPGGRKRILFKGANGKRRAIRLGKLSVKAAQSILARVEALEAAGLSGTPWDTETEANLRTQLHRIIKRAGLKPWPKCFQNCWSTRETELAEKYPLHVVCSWLGNSQAVAAKHYLQVTDKHFQQASEGGAESGALTAQNEAQPVAADIRHHPKESTQALAPVDNRPVLAEDGEAWQVTPTGLEPVLPA